MTSESGTAPAKHREPTEHEKHYLEHHISVVVDEKENCVHIGFSHACKTPSCPVQAQAQHRALIFRACPSPPCAPG
jgi:hypothetical protein